MSFLHQSKAYLKYRRHAKSHQRIHSPFVFHLLKDVFYSRVEKDAYVKIEKRRDELLEMHKTIEVTDLGAGAQKWGNSQRSISKIARNSLKRKKYALLIYKLVHHFQPKNSLELGTSLGITTAYIAQGYPQGLVTSIEGCPNIARIAQETFQETQTQNIQSLVGNFDDIIPKLIDENLEVNFVFIDGNHSYEPTLRYFEWCLSMSNNETVFIFDDIHWSSDMEKAWFRIQNHPRVTITVDIFEMGIVFIRNENKEKEHFVIKY